eukprot:4833836-Amphidinium_carterae.1
MTHWSDSQLNLTTTLALFGRRLARLCITRCYEPASTQKPNLRLTGPNLVCKLRGRRRPNVTSRISLGVSFGSKPSRLGQTPKHPNFENFSKRC